MNITLRPYQVEAVQALRNILAGGAHRVILSSPTGSGKTEMGFDLIRGAQSKGKKVAFIANRIQLVDQTCRRLDEAEFTYGVIQGQNTHMPWSSILVCSIQTLASRGCPEDIDLFVIDEAHACAGTKEYRKIMEGKYCIGLTATPYSKGLGKHYESLGGNLFEKVVIATPIKKLIEDGYLVGADIWAPGEPDLSSVKTTAGDYNKKQLGEAVDKVTLVGDIVTHWLKIANNTPTVCFATNISHSKHIVEQFLASGVTAEHLDHYTKPEDRKAILERVSNGETMVISNVGILCEGWDFPACKTLILARPTKSLIRYLQMAGRVLRPYPGKTSAIILDHSGAVRRLGFPWDDFGQELDNGKAKEGLDKKTPEESLPKPCPRCSFMKPPKTPICPYCGFESKQPNAVNTQDGELVPITVTTKELPTLYNMGRGSIYHQLLWVANKRGYSKNWAKHKYKKIFKQWPNHQSEATEEACGPLLSWIRSENIAWAKEKKTAEVISEDH